MTTTAKRHRKQATGQPWIVDLREHVSELSSKVDRTSGVIHDVKVLGNVSKNNRTYSDRAKRDACQLLEGITVNFDHNRNAETPERKFMEGIGTLHGLHVMPDGVYAKELRVKKSHPNAEVLFESAERFPKSFGLSINAGGVTNKAGTIVESIKQARSVDIVGNPATTNGLFESENNARQRMVKTSIKQIVESMGDAKYSARCSKIMEDGASAAMMGAPIDMDQPVDDSGAPTDGDPLEQLKDAFAALIVSVLENDGITPDDKKKQIGAMIDTMNELMTGDASGSKKESIKEDEEPEEDNDMTESVETQLTAILESVKETNATAKETAILTKRNSVQIRLIESNVEPKPERIDAILGAKDEAAIVSLIESWPTKQRAATVTKPRMKASEQSADAPAYPTSHEDFVSLAKR